LPTLYAPDANWKAVDIGAGGWITGIDVAPDGTMVARTDTYGAYIWNGTEWRQLVTSQSMPSSVLSGAGVYEIRVSASNSNVFYMQTGEGIYKTVDKGATWTKTAFPATIFDANSNNRMDGEKMAIDPTNSNIVFAGTQKSGLWVTRDGGGTWQKITAVPQGANTTDPSLTGIAIKGSTVYVGTAGSGVYASNDGGYTWKAIGGPVDVSHGVISADGSYYATGNTDTALWKFSSGTWKKLIASEVHGVAIDPFNPSHVIVTRESGNIQESKDAGATWTGWNWANQLESSNDVPWLENSGSYMSAGGLVFDPLNQGKLWQSSGVGVWETSVPSQLDWNTPVVWNSQSMGIEQLVTNDIIAPAGGNPVFASWDRPFFEKSDLDTYSTGYGGGHFSMGWSVDYASTNSKFIVGISDWWGTDDSGFSADGGATWQKFASLPTWALNSVGGSIAASTPNNIIWAPSGNNAPAYTLDGGNTWKTISITGKSDWSGLHSSYYLDRTTITADRVQPNTFYLYDAATGVYRTTDGGVNWTKMFSGQVSAYSQWNAKIEAVPGKAGQLFFTSGPLDGDPAVPMNVSFMRSKDGGATWQAVANVQEVHTFGYGAPSAAGGPASVYIVGYVKGVYGVWYSADDAQTWTQIGQNPLHSLDNIKTISGDMDQFGRVYVGFGGSGFAYFDVAATAPAPTPTTSTTPSQTVFIANAIDDVGVQATLLSGALTNDSTPLLQGTLSAPLGQGQVVAVYRDGQKIGTGAVNSTAWTFSDPGAGEGSHGYVARVEDTAGNQGAPSTSFTLTIDTTAPKQAVNISAAVDDVGAVTGTLSSGATTDDTSPLVKGSLSSELTTGEVLVVYRDGIKIGLASVSATQWSFSDSNVPAGTRSYTARVEDGAGNVGSNSNSFSLTFSQLQNVTGTIGNDALFGTSGADRISGVPGSGIHIGKGTKDVLTGAGGSDLFILGDSRGVYYSDGKNGSSGTGDYVRITDFGADDKLQLSGSLSNYFQAQRTIDGFTGNAIYHDSNGNGSLDSRDELIALVQNQGNIDLSGMIFI
jgi:photosystem II stability/assembly factor-like uncharacterized protein